MQRPTLTTPAQPWFDRLESLDRLAVVDVVLDGHRALADLLGFVIEPAVRLGRDVIVVADLRLDDLDDLEFVEPDFGYAYTLGRLRWLMSSARPRRTEPATLVETSFDPDRMQGEAVSAGRGVVQIIAPAGSGKTTVLVERVRELVRRGVPADAITCLTFNKAAKIELEDRLGKAGVGNAEALTFHGLGRKILKGARKLCENVGKGPSLGQWRQLATVAKQRAGEGGVFLDAGEAKRHLSEIKLGRLASPQEYAATITDASDGLSRTLAQFYTAYEEQQREYDRMDYDDLILRALQLLRAEPELREAWQQRWECLLVDEYQDIEPAQELLVRLLAAPHDQLFCVGDEDQTLYAFRRASVRRIICLDELYPALRRIPLEVNYRCPARVVVASARLIAVNKVRFGKRIAPAPGRADDATVTLCEVSRQIDAAVRVAQALKGRSRGEIAVLARTIDALRPVALACADQDVAIDGPDRLFQAQGARRALHQHLLLASAPERADEQLVRAVCQTPGRSLQRGAESQIAAKLRAGMSFNEAFVGVDAPRRPRRDKAAMPLMAPGELLTEVAGLEDAGDAVWLLRDDGGLDDWFAESDGLGGISDFDSEVLEQAAGDASGRTISAYLKQLSDQAGQLEAIRDEHGVELATIHGSKGREWPHVIVVCCDQGTLPHTRALSPTADDAARGEGIEAERRLAYVAFTRAKEQLELYHDTRNASEFLDEAGLRKAPTGHTGRPALGLPPDGGRSALRERRRGTADRVERRRVSRRATISGLAGELELSADELVWILGASRDATLRTKLRKLHRDQAAALARAICDLD